MSSKFIKYVIIAGALVVSAIGAYWYYSPYLVVNGMRAAIDAKDVDAFNERMDYPKIRENIKGQFSAMMSEKIAEMNEEESGFAALGAMLGVAIVEKMIDAMIQPGTLMRAMQEGRNPMSDRKDRDATEGGTKRDVKLTFARKGANKLIAYVADAANSDGKETDAVGLVFERSGFADWKMVDIRMPLSNQ